MPIAGPARKGAKIWKVKHTHNKLLLERLVKKKMMCGSLQCIRKVESEERQISYDKGKRSLNAQTSGPLAAGTRIRGQSINIDSGTVTDSNAVQTCNAYNVYGQYKDRSHGDENVDAQDDS